MTLASRWNGSAALEPSGSSSSSNNAAPTSAPQRRPSATSRRKSSGYSSATYASDGAQPDSVQACIISDEHPVGHEILYGATAAAVMCLAGSIEMVRGGNPVALVYTVWWIGSVTLWIWAPGGGLLSQMMDNGSLSLSRSLTVSYVMAVHLFVLFKIQHGVHHLYNASMFVIPGILLLFFARKVLTAHEQHRRELLRRISLEHASSQDRLSLSRLALLNAVAQEIQGVAWMITSTLEHLSPASIVARTHELLSACTIAVPITSISAIQTAIKQVNHVSDNLDLVTRLLASAHDDDDDDDDTPNHSNSQSQQQGADATTPTEAVQQFDIGELVQSVGDALAGMAANLDVHLVIYHADNGLHYSNVTGNEGIIRHTLLDLLSRIMDEGCTPGATVEVGLGMVSHGNGSRRKRITLDIVHTCSPALPISLEAVLTPNASFTAQLMRHAGGSLVVEELDRGRTLFRLTIELQPGEMDADEQNQQHLFMPGTSSQSQILQNHLTGIQFSNEPTRAEIAQFVHTHLKGIRMVLHAPEQSVFATHLTSYLANLNVDISHIPISRFPRRHHNHRRRQDNSNDPDHPHTHPQRHQQQPTFVLIDDDTFTLEQQLRDFRSQPPVSDKMLQQHQQQQRRQKHGKATSSNSSGNSTAGGAGGSSGGPHATNFFHHGTQAIICFASLNSYKQIREVIQRFSAGAGHHHPFGMPRVVVVPKPAGPLRFLTALHTAWNNPMVEPHYFPIATTPYTPMTMPPIPMMHHHPHHQQPHTGSPLSDSAIHPASTTTTSHQSSSGGRRNGHQQRHGSGGSGSGGGSGTGYYTPPGVNWSDKHYFMQEIGVPRSTGSGGGNSSMVSSPHTTSDAGGGGSYTTREHRMRSSSGTFITTSRQVESRMDALATPYRPTIANPFGTDDDDDDDDDGPPSGRRFVHMNVAATAAAGRLMGPGHIADDDDDMEDHGDSTGSRSTQPPTAVGPLEDVSSDSITDLTAAAAAAAAAKVDATSPDKSKTSSPMTAPKFRRMVRKKKRDKGTPFSGMMSPPIHVLIVEDNKINQVILQTWMKKHNIKHSSAMNGQEAVEKWKGGGFHLVLMDIQLPVMDGLEATKTIRTIEKEQKIGVLPIATATSLDATGNDPSTTNSIAPSDPQTPFRSPVIIVALTASSSEADRHAALAAGCNDFLTKPVSLEWLEKKIVEWGCMQALIDFEGWRRWRQSTTTQQEAAVAAAAVDEQQLTPSRRASKQRDSREALEEEEDEEEEGAVSSAHLPDSRSMASFFDNTGKPYGILLPGVGERHPEGQSRHQQQRRVSSMDVRPSSSSFTSAATPGQGVARASSIRSKRLHRLPSLPIKSGSDSDLFIGLTAPPTPCSPHQQPGIGGENGKQHRRPSPSPFPAAGAAISKEERHPLSMPSVSSSSTQHR